MSDIVKRLNDEFVRLSGRSIERGCVDSGIASNIAAQAAAEITRLRTLLDEAADKACANADRFMALADQVVALREQNAALSACVAELEEGLMPFAKAADELPPLVEDNERRWPGHVPMPTAGEVRRARALTKGRGVMPSFTYYECDDCGFNTVRDRDNIPGACPICAEDNGRDGSMRGKPCPPDQGPVEGRDDRPAPSPKGSAP